MSDRSGSDPRFTLKRREFLSSAALPVAAALAPSALLGQQRETPIRVGIIGAGGIVSSVHVPGLKRQPGVELPRLYDRFKETRAGSA